MCSKFCSCLPMPKAVRKPHIFSQIREAAWDFKQMAVRFLAGAGFSPLVTAVFNVFARMQAQARVALGTAHAPGDFDH